MIDSITQGIFENAQPIAIFLTFLVAVMTQYLSVTKEVTGPDGKKTKKVTVWGILLLPIMSIGAAFSIFLHLEESTKIEKEMAAKTELQEQITNNFSLVLKDTGTLLTVVPEVQNTCREVGADVEVLTKLAQEQFALIRSKLGHTGDNCPKDNKDNETVSTLRNEINALTKEKQMVASDRIEAAKKQGPTLYNYTFQLKTLDVSQCENKDVEYYWDIKLGTQSLALLKPKSSKKPNANNQNIVSFDNATLQIEDVRSPNAQFVVSGYVRELTGRSMFRRYYQYRYPGVFSRVIAYDAAKDGLKPIKISFNASDQKQNGECSFTILGDLNRSEKAMAP